MISSLVEIPHVTWHDEIVNYFEQVQSLYFLWNYSTEYYHVIKMTNYHLIENKLQFFFVPNLLCEEA